MTDVEDFQNQIVRFTPIVMNQPSVTEVPTLWYVYVERTEATCEHAPTRHLAAITTDEGAKNKVVRRLKKDRTVSKVTAFCSTMPKGTWLGDTSWSVN